MRIYIDKLDGYNFEGHVLSEDLTQEQLKELGLYWMHAYDRNFKIALTGEYSIQDYDYDGYIELCIEWVFLWSPDNKKCINLETKHWISDQGDLVEDLKLDYRTEIENLIQGV